MWARAALAVLLFSLIPHEGKGAIYHNFLLWNIIANHCESDGTNPARKALAKSPHNSGAINFGSREGGKITDASHYCYIVKHVPGGIGVWNYFVEKQRSFIWKDGNIIRERKLTTWENHKSDRFTSFPFGVSTNLLLDFWRNSVDKANDYHPCFDAYIKGRRLSNIFDVCCDKKIDTKIVGIRKIAVWFYFQPQPRSFIGHHGILQGVISFPKNQTGPNGSEKKQERIDRKPQSITSYGIALAKPPKWLWLALLGAASLFGLFSLVAAPKVHPAPRLHNIATAAIFILGILLGLAAIPAAILSF